MINTNTNTNNTNNINSTNTNDIINFNKPLNKPTTLRTTNEFEAYSCKFSNFEKNLIACTYSQYYGIVGNGRICIYDFDPYIGRINEIARFNTNDGCFDLSWSEANENHFATCQGDGTVKIWDLKLPQPIGNIQSHAGEVYSVNWSHQQTELLLTSGNDSTIKLHDINKMVPVHTYVDHKNVVYKSTWHPTLNGVFASCSADTTFKIWDTKTGGVVRTINAHNAHVMDCDFNKYDNILATAGGDGTIAIWDLRGTSDVPALALNAHMLSTKKLAFSPFDSSLLASVSYDMNVMLWNIKNSKPVNIFKHHTEFVCGVDFSMFDKNLMATCSWDKSLVLLNGLGN